MQGYLLCIEKLPERMARVMQHHTPNQITNGYVPNATDVGGRNTIFKTISCKLDSPVLIPSHFHPSIAALRGFFLNKFFLFTCPGGNIISLYKKEWPYQTGKQSQMVFHGCTTPHFPVRWRTTVHRGNSTHDSRNSHRMGSRDTHYLKAGSGQERRIRHRDMMV